MTTQLPVVLTLRAQVLIMYVEIMSTGRILNLCRFDELPCHLTQALCREAATDHLVRMVERGRLQATKFLHPTPSDTAFQEWIAKVVNLDGAIPPPSTYIHLSTESPLLYQKLRDTTTAAWTSPADALIAIHLILQERSKSGVGVPGQRTIFFSKRDETPRAVCQINIPGFKSCEKVEAYGHSELEALVQACLSACQLLQMGGLLEPAHFPTVSPFVAVPRAIEPQQPKKAKSSGVHTHPRRNPLFWPLSTEALGGLWHPTIAYVDGLAGKFGPLTILTRHPLPAIPDFVLFFSGKRMYVRTRKCQPRSFSSNELEKLRRATLRILRFISNKPFVSDLNKLPYLLFPLRRDIALLDFLRGSRPALEGLPCLGSPCESKIVEDMCSSVFLPIAVDSTEEINRDLEDAVIQDRKIEYTKHYFVDRVRQDLSPSHRPQEGDVRVQLLSLMFFLTSL